MSAIDPSREELDQIDRLVAKASGRRELLDITTAIAAGMSANPCHAGDSPGLIACVAGARAKEILAEVKARMAPVPGEDTP